MGKFTRIPADTFEQIQTDVGILLYNFDPAAPDAVKDEDIICPTTGGITAACTPTFSDMGEDVDNCPAKAELSRFRNKNRKTVHAIQDEAAAALKVLRKSLAAHIAEWSAADPDKMDQSAVMLLNSGAMKDTDLVALANKYWNNPTMLKMIACQAEKNLDDSKIARFLATKISRYIAPTDRLRVFDDAVSVAMRTIQDNGNIAGTFQQKWSAEFKDSLRAAMAQHDTFKMEV